jgi:hypothetical protein
MLGEYHFLGYLPDNDIHFSFIHWIMMLYFLLILNLFRYLGQISDFSHFSIQPSIVLFQVLGHFPTQLLAPSMEWHN